MELASLQSLMPLHSVTASALSTSLLSLQNDKWGCLSEGNSYFCFSFIYEAAYDFQVLDVTSLDIYIIACFTMLLESFMILELFVF